MSSKIVILLSILCLHCDARPVRKTLNFNMFVLPHDGAEKTILTTDGVSRFGPVLEYLVQRVQGLLSVRLPPEALEQSSHNDQPSDIENPSSDISQHSENETETSDGGPISENVSQSSGIENQSSEQPPKDPAPLVPLADAAENEVDHQESVIPGVVVRPSQTKPGTFEVEIDIVVDDEQFKKP